MTARVLTEKQVQEIRRERDEAHRERIAAGLPPRIRYGTSKRLAKVYGVSPHTIQAAIWGRNYRDVR